MKKGMLLLLVLALGAGGVAVTVGKRAIPRYDEMVRLRENTQREWAQIDVLLHKRYDLIPRLVDAVKGYDAHEIATLQAAAEAWTGYGRASTLDEKVQATYRTEQNIRSFAMLGQLHPDLKSNVLFLQLMRSLNDTEDQIARQRMAYNTAASALNSDVHSFYGRFVAWAGGIQPAPYYQNPAEVREPPKAAFTSQLAAGGFHADALVLKGTIAGGTVRRAVLETPDGKDLIVAPGMEIRGASAKVESIGEHEVTLLQTVTNQDGVANTREIRIHQ